VAAVLIELRQGFRSAAHIESRLELVCVNRKGRRRRLHIDVQPAPSDDRPTARIGHRHQNISLEPDLALSRGLADSRLEVELDELLV